jgi:hypothetical protein
MRFLMPSIVSRPTVLNAFADKLLKFFLDGVRSLGKESQEGHWQVYFDFMSNEVTVHASDERRAREALFKICSLQQVKPRKKAST